MSRGQRLAVAGCVLLLAACGADDPRGAAIASARPGAAGGSIDIVLTAETLGRNSRGEPGSVACVLRFAATNNGADDLKSLLAEFEVVDAGSGAMIDADATLVMPFRIARGERKDAWGPIHFDDRRCEDLKLTVQQPGGTGRCLTLSGAACPPYRLSGTGVADAR